MRSTRWRLSFNCNPVSNEWCEPRVVPLISILDSFVELLCIGGIYLLPYRTKFSTDKIFRWTKFSTPSRNFDSFVRFLPDFCIEILVNIFDRQNFSSDRIFATKLKFWQFCPMNFCTIRYIKSHVKSFTMFFNYA